MKPIGNLADSGQFAWGVVFISDPDRTDNPTVEPLRRAFDLTYREAQAIAIADGHGLQAAADKRGVALTTARSQLEQAFAKQPRHARGFLLLSVCRQAPNRRQAAVLVEKP